MTRQRRSGRSPRRSGRSIAHPIAAFIAAIGLLGAVLLIAGSVQAAQANTIVGIPEAAPDIHLAPPETGDRHQVAAPSSAPAPPTRPSSASPPPAPRSAAAAAAAQPANTIRLPRGDVASLIQEPVAADGSLPIPPGVHEATWWGVGFNAGSGATLFAGHVNWAGSIGPFAELWQDNVGGIVTVTDGQGRVWRFRVAQAITVPKDQLPAQAPALFGQSGPRRIVLATCGGEWVGGQEGYNENRVLIATPI
jgi:hypothetical protein